MPSEGEVRIFVTSVVTASHFYAWILQHWEVPPGTKKVDKAAIQENTDLQDAMLYLAEYFSEPENHEPLKEDALPRTGEVYGLEVAVDCFQRVLVLSYARVKSGPTQVTVMHMDYGGQSAVAVTRLLHLPPRLRLLRPLAVEVHCCRVQPQDRDVSWSFQADLASHQLFARKELVGRVVLRLGNVLWLDPLVLREELRSVDVEVNARHVRTSLIRQGWACSNPSHVENLRKLTTEAGLPVPPLPAGKQEHADETLAIPRQLCTTFLDTRVYSHVYVWKVYSPSRFYVQPLKFNSCLDKLEDDIMAAVKQGKVKVLQSPKVGDTCLAPLDNSPRLYRAEVVKLLNGDEVEVEYPDYGDSGKVRRCQVLGTQPWMLLLPYQGIECCLAGIRPPGGDPSQPQWDPRALQELEDFAYDDNNINQIRCLLVVGTAAAHRPGALRYEVFLFGSCAANSVSMADKLVHLGLAVATDPSTPKFDPNVPHEPLLHEAEDEACGTETDSESGEATDRQCQANLENHMLGIFGEVRDQVLVPAVQELLEQMGLEDGAGEPPAGAVGSAEPVSAQGPQAQQSRHEGTPPAAEATEEPQPQFARGPHDYWHGVRAPVTWWQDDYFVYVDVIVRNATNYVLCTSDRDVSFKVRNADNNKFVVYEDLFAPIKPEGTGLMYRTNSVGIILQKAEPHLVWDYLLRVRHKVPNIRFNYDHLDVSDDEDEDKSYHDKDSAITGYVRPGYILPYDPVAHDERALEIDAEEEYVHDPVEDMYHSLDPNDIFEGSDGLPKSAWAV